ncbi:MAG: hypothetical protein OXH08_05305 [Gammaproteobacteria bacterium]|nr:hypothetical protein [Gammaproteobacteria bacterium]
MGRTTAGERQVDERSRIDAPAAGITPERPHGLDDLDAGAVALDDEGQAGIITLAGGQENRAEKRDGPWN